MSKAARVADKVRDLGVRAGVLPYRKRWVLSSEDWDREYGGGVLDYYGDLRELARYSVLVGYIRNHPGTPSILDVGCGVGLLRERLPDGEVGRYVGIDPSAVAIEQAQGRGWRDAEFVVGATPETELGTFDVIVANEVLYYVDDLAFLLGRLEALLAPGGLLVTSIVRHPGDVSLDRALDERFEQRDAVVVRSETGPGNAWRVALHGRRGEPAANGNGRG
ncbi:MAG: class SAM-dependent methyltransferase [Conexibacter sp.]|nr:class SAM-dependent methyltransferase [Conexibacter sp.]